MFLGFGRGSKAGAAAGGASEGSTKANGAEQQSSSAPFPGLGNLGSGGILPPGLDPAKIQDFFQKQTPEKQREIMEKALEMQKMLGKIPGFGGVANRNAKMMEQLLKGGMGGETAVAASPASVPTSVGAGGNSGAPKTPGHAKVSGSPNGPTLEDLKKIDLGPEIEALFKELKAMRDAKNSYRAKLREKEIQCSAVESTLAQLKDTEASLRSKLKKTEHDVMLLNSENIELKERSGEIKQLRQQNATLTQQVRRLGSGDASHLKSENATLLAQLQERDEVVRALQRKLERQRRRDPLLQFSLLSSDIMRLCPGERSASERPSGPAADASAQHGGSGGVSPAASVVALHQPGADALFADLQRSYEASLQTAWAQAAGESGRAAKVLIASAEQFFRTSLPYSNLDALLIVNQRDPLHPGVASSSSSTGGTLSALRSVFSPCHISVEHMGDNKFLLSMDGDTVGPTSCGAYGLAVAWKLVNDAELRSKVGDVLGDSRHATLSVTSVTPRISPSLLKNTRRTSIQYESTRSSGPGGQAANVTETQISAKVFIDGEYLYKTEAQDSRSTLSNKEAALEKVYGTKCKHFNEQLAKEVPFEAARETLLRILTEKGGVDMSAALDMVRSAVQEKHVTAAKVALVLSIHALSVDRAV